MSYRAQCAIYDKLLNILESAESRLTNVTAQYEETRSTNTEHDALGDQLATLEDQVRKLTATCEKMGVTLDEVLWYINALVPSHPNVARVLSKRYLEPKYEPTFAEISAEMGYSEDWVKHKHLEGLDLVYELMSE